MPIGPETLLELVRKRKLVSKLDQRELRNPEGAGFDLRVGRVYEIFGEAFLGIKDRQTPKAKLVAKYNPRKRASYTLRPGEYVLMMTMESFKLPPDIVGYTSSRTTVFRSGVNLICSPIQPGYVGELTFGLKNEGPVDFTFELGARIAHVQFDYVQGGGAAYRGQWQGGRVTTSGREEQI
ncbi:hypothetical protein A2V56_01745 [Candidatus Woesebacteria bacterium RBG_19FT_COMBO_42_9]|uniref:Uncharacterized protein n=1 Tax=Candidatus Woesebacteria bacterium RBG_16_42_24 TaxID=1802485 RepID=A0A1F7XJX2_9BACT|nr:MAG: hypothetical protein A2V97_01530 [Candidatus Woesebacteria bacterium RBG_16_42_24]OGM17549.1 MAG: hypothetical protein A2V56_01745 [Candidatus Woesebacteria bacterium RBG_19FT_COMBO_42_9]OGM67624.1 MAG: hypothetical protein A2985_00470 [Candidatus Woesebacteria bacterium RIFCSPLOWO2_01_FULL_43_11]